MTEPNQCRTLRLADAIALCVVVSVLVVLLSGQSGVVWIDVAIIQLIAVAAPTAAIAAARGNWIERLGLTPPRPRAIAGAALCGATLWFASLVVIAPLALRLGGDLVLTSPGWQAALVTLALAPMCEEVLFRGALARAVGGRFGLVAGVISSSALFAVFHIAPARMPGMFVLGVFAALLCGLSGSTWAGITAHFVNNLTALAVSGPARPALSWALENRAVCAPIAALLAVAGVVIAAQKTRV